MLFYFVIALTFLSMRKSLGGNTVMPITLEHYDESATFFATPCTI